jgi:hypothetical protein
MRSNRLLLMLMRRWPMSPVALSLAPISMFFWCWAKRL